ncbi:phage protein NinX family protein [Enterobacter sp. 638]|uniref:phage protein NinX family protein n=1 Tax=Enterobacter sp. (strain 638) TaxID=399742 RepID=UPI001232475E|nr:phage protein NinX family protein [Enterobacter sp. 638]
MVTEVVMDYSKMSDFEINKRVAFAEGLQVQDIDDSKATGMTSKYHELRPHTVWVTDGENPWEQYAPTLCWEDAGSIIVSSRIGINFVNGIWRAQSMKTGWVEFIHENPLRAAMTVFLMMQESANVPANPAGPDIR